MLKDLLFGSDGILVWSGFISIIYILFGSRTPVKKWIVIGWSTIIVALIILSALNLIQ